MWYRCNIQLPDVVAARLFPQGFGGRVFRRLVALMCDEDRLQLPPAILNYEAGNPAQSAPPVRFAGYARGVAILGVGPEGAELARAIAPVIHAALTRRAQAILPVSEQSGLVKFSPRPYSARYYLPAAVLSPTRGVHRWLQWIDEARDKGLSLAELPEANSAIADRIEAGLVRQLDSLDPAEAVEGTARTNWGLLPDESDELTMVRRGSRPFTVTVHSCGKPFVETRMNNTARALRDAGGSAVKGNLPLVGVRAVEVSINAEFDGIWQVGRLTSSGYGLLLKSNRVAELSEVA